MGVALVGLLIQEKKGTESAKEAFKGNIAIQSHTIMIILEIKRTCDPKMFSESLFLC